MAKQIVDEILAAESKGRKLLEEAEISARETVNAAKLEAQNIIAKAEKANEQNTRDAVALANSQAQEQAQLARVHTETIGREYSERASARHDAAVDAVIALLVQ